MVVEFVILMTSCAVCSCPSSKACARCHVTYYCSANYQKEDWQTHRDICVAVPPTQHPICRSLFNWYKRALRKPRNDLIAKQYAVLELFSITSIAEMILSPNHQLLCSFRLHFVQLGLETQMNPTFLENAFTKAKQATNEQNQYVLAKLCSKVAQRNDPDDEYWDCEFPYVPIQRPTATFAKMHSSFPIAWSESRHRLQNAWIGCDRGSRLRKKAKQLFKKTRYLL